MANLATALKEEITRIARKELRNETDSMRKTSARYRTEIATLKRQVTTLEQLVARLEKRLAKVAPAKATATEPTKLRFSANRLKTMRQKLNLSAAGMGRLVGVSGQTIYNWESGVNRPKPEQLIEIAAVRKMGKRAIVARLNEAGIAEAPADSDSH